MRHCVYALLLLLLLPVACLAAAPFGIAERPATARDGIHARINPLWQRVLDEETANPAFTASGEYFRPVDVPTWRNLVVYAKKIQETERLRLVNGYFNQWLPKDDLQAWNQNEHWATPREFFNERGGDCEDYAIAKYFALRFLGLDPDRMRVIVVRRKDPSGKGLPNLHAVLAVRDKDSWWILDNNARPRDNIFPHSQYHGRFVPLYSVNEKGAWVHGK